MKSVLLATVLLSVSVITGFGESRTLGIKIEKAGSEEPGVSISIFSDVKREDKRGLSIGGAVSILDSVQGSGSSVLVGIVTSDVPLQDYLPILQAISQNGWLQLVFVEQQQPSFIADNIWKRIRGSR